MSKGMLLVLGKVFELLSLMGMPLTILFLRSYFPCFLFFASGGNRGHKMPPSSVLPLVRLIILTDLLYFFSHV
jgi:hypothetical protein